MKNKMRKKIMTAASQKELNDAFQGENFVFANRYAAVLNIIFASLFYSGGMPLLYFTASASFFFMYICDKVTSSSMQVPGKDGR
jgi:hypothetical protein